MKKMFKAFDSYEIRSMVKRMERREKIIAIILLFAMILSMIPYQVFAKTEDVSHQESEVSQEEHTYSYDVASKDIPIVAKDTSKRTINEKHFRKEDGTYEVAIYDGAVHYYLHMILHL